MEGVKTITNAQSFAPAAEKAVHKKEGDPSFTPSFYQTKLTIGSPDDPLEKEADDMADRIMRMEMPVPINFSLAKHSVNRKCADCEEEEMQLQRKENSNESVSVAPLIVHDVIGSSGGKSIDSDTRSFMESRFNYDFSNVKIHDGDLAAKSASSINALAYTSGSNIVFNSGQFNTSSDSGKRLLAHELTHVVQQNQTSLLQPKLIQRRSGCTSTQDTTISDDHSRARQMLNNAISIVSSYNGTTPAKVNTALARHFNGATSNAFATWINTNLRLLWGLTWMAGYECFSGGAWESTWACRGADLATTFWCVPTIAIRLCPSYFGQSDVERSTTLIHEWVHKYGCNFDLGYEHESDYGSNSTITQLLNADSFSSFIRDVQ